LRSGVRGHRCAVYDSLVWGSPPGAEENTGDCFLENVIELRILDAARRLLTGRVNKLLADAQYPIPLVEFYDCEGGNVINPVLGLSTCERTEKELDNRQTAYALTISFSMPETSDSEFYCHAYAAAICNALEKDPTLEGVVNNAAVTGKKYNMPNEAYGNYERAVVLNLRVTVEKFD
jgi:hypothetical protein